MSAFAELERFRLVIEQIQRQIHTATSSESEYIEAMREVRRLVRQTPLDYEGAARIVARRYTRDVPARKD